MIGEVDGVDERPRDSPSESGDHAGVKRWLTSSGGGLALAMLALWLALAPAHIVDGDNAELATLGTLGGAAHPPGYPLYLLYLRAFSWLPASSPAHAAALATALLAALHVLVLHAACRAWGVRAFAATLACAIYATSPIVLREYCEADVFALNGLVVSAVLWLSAAAGPLRGGRRAVMLGLVAGLGLANNTSCVMFAPLGLYGVWFAWREARLRALYAIVGLAIGMLPYAYLFIARDGAGTWGAVRSLGDAVAMFIRSDYGAGQLSAHKADVSLATREGAMLGDIARAWLVVPLVGAGWAFVRRLRSPSRGIWIALALTVVIVGPVFAIGLNVPPTGYGAWLVPRFHLLAILVLSIPIATGIDLVVDRVRPALRIVVLVVVVAVNLVLSLPWLARVHSSIMEDGVTNLLRSLPKDAIVIATPDDINFGGTYAQEVLGERRDVTVLIWQLVAADWYRRRIEAQGIALGPVPISSVKVAEGIVASQRPLFVDIFQANILGAFPAVPYGTVFRVLPKGTPMPPIEEAVAENRALFAKFILVDPPRASDDVPALVYARYAQTWHILAEGLARAGRGAEAQQAAAIADALLPQ